MNLTVKSGLRPTESMLAANDGGDDRPGAPPPAERVHPKALGMSFGAADDAELHERLGLPADVRGAVVLSVKGSSDAGEKGVKPGDVVVRAGDRSVRSPGDIPAAVADAKHAGRSSILLGIYRDGRTTFLPIKLEG
jgi:serine protease Do